jgi:hypothetical protein
MQVETIRLSRELRRRYAFLGHLPEHSNVVFAELDLSNMLSDKVSSTYIVHVRM